jgi:hypothetical protein
MPDETPPFRYSYRGSGAFRESYLEKAVWELCVCGGYFWRWEDSEVEHCARCLAAHPELRPQKGVDRSHQA